MNSMVERRGVIVSGLAAVAVAAAATKKPGPGQEKETGAVEDLMREHGVLRRALLVYREIAPRIRSGASLDPAVLQRTAKLFRAFGEDYHEKKLEEAYIFPTVRKTKGPAAAYPDVLVAQHDRGRAVTDYLLAVTTTGPVLTSHATDLAQALETFVVMYQNHAAREDTVVFPAWKTALSQKQLDELGDRFEEIEKQQFGTDGYEDAVKQIDEIERALGLGDLAQFTPPPPPRV